jgi:uncharacterized protein YndB with AHSA1/START domain
MRYGQESIQKTIKINAPTDKVWRVFTDPVITRQMGGEYVTDWKAGSSFGWKGEDGKMYANGTILQVENEKLIKHNLLDVGEKEKILSVITYKFESGGTQTTLHSLEELNYEMTDQQYKDASEGWDFALAAIKEIAEKP